jgi:hypothetical protein
MPFLFLSILKEPVVIFNYEIGTILRYFTSYYGQNVHDFAC